jgi:hypothetical protein
MYYTYKVNIVKQKILLSGRNFLKRARFLLPPTTDVEPRRGFAGQGENPAREHFAWA